MHTVSREPSLPPVRLALPLAGVQHDIEAFIGKGWCDVFVHLENQSVRYNPEEHSRRSRLVTLSHTGEARCIVCGNVMKHMVCVRRFKQRSHPCPAVSCIVCAQIEDDIVAETQQFNDMRRECVSQPPRCLKVVVKTGDWI